MKHLNEWGKGKVLGLVIMAQQLAVSVEPFFEFLKLIKSGDRVKDFSSLPKAKEWARLYRNHRKIQKSMVEKFKGYRGIGGSLFRWIISR
jgi:hypothetical protein